MSSLDIPPPSPVDAAPPVAPPTRVTNAMTIDVEDYFHVQAFAGVIPRDDWNSLPSRVTGNTERLLSLFDETGVKATFFVLGWIAERDPALIRRIAAAGHEIASHGYSHTRADAQTPDIFRDDIVRAKALLEDATGTAVRGYRAASFSIGPGNWWAFDVLAEAGHSYSSSIYPIRHDHYGMPNGERWPFRVSGTSITEIPLSTVRILGRNYPCAGGGYFRLAPLPVSRWALRRLNLHERRPAIFYLHPWEIDPEQPRQSHAPLKSRLRHYINLRATEQRLRHVLTEFAWDRMDKVFDRAIQQ